MKTTSLRTQITLSKALREDIDQARISTGESLSGYLNKSARIRLDRDKDKKIDLEKLAKQIVGSIKKNDSGWGSITESSWQKERSDEEAYHEKRLHSRSRKRHNSNSKKQELESSDIFILGDK